MAKSIKIKKGLDIPLSGHATGSPVKDKTTELFAITPSDFTGYTWKVAVKPGDKVMSGDRLLFAKENPEIALTSTVSGTVEEIRRGERRKIEFVSVKKDSDDKKKSFTVETDALKLLQALSESGLFALIRQRPFDIIPDVNVVPRDIFITGFDSAPLAPDLITDFVKKYLNSGLKALKALTSGKIYLSLRQGSGITSDIAEIIEVDGPHPAGTAGVVINHVSPVNKGETVWTLDITTAARIGKFLEEGIADFSCIVAVTGPEVNNPFLIDTYFGASISSLLKGKLKNTGKCRIVSGNVLTGERTDLSDGFLRFPYRQITVISEGDDADEFMGWASMNPKKFSVKRTFPAFLRGLGKNYDFDARIKGGHRAMIMSGEYDDVFPMDIYPEYLVKAVLAKDIDKMEKLGIYEVAPEDFALPEFVDTSKLELQKIIRDGLDYLRKETI